METAAITRSGNSRTIDRDLLQKRGVTGLIMYHRMYGGLNEERARQEAIDIRVKLNIFTMPERLTLEECDRIIAEFADRKSRGF